MLVLIGLNAETFILKFPIYATGNRAFERKPTRSFQALPASSSFADSWNLPVWPSSSPQDFVWLASLQKRNTERGFLSGKPPYHSRSLRILTGLVLLIGVIIPGYLGYSPWIILTLTLAYTVSFVIGRIRRWRAAFGDKGAAGLIGPILSTALVQLILVSLLYVIGFGFGALFSGHEGLRAFEPGDWIYAAVLGGIGAAAGSVIAYLESRSSVNEILTSTNANMAAASDQHSTFGAVVFGPSVTVETFWRKTSEKHLRPPLSDNDIAAVETRLDVALPKTLKALFRLHGGGLVSHVLTVIDDASPPYTIYNTLSPFSGYERVHDGLELETVATSFLSFADPHDAENYGHLFTGGTDKMVLLAQWYLESLFLDYNQTGEPRVGFVDFDDLNWQDKIRWWDSFEAFFAELRHIKDE